VTAKLLQLLAYTVSAMTAAANTAATTAAGAVVLVVAAAFATAFAINLPDTTKYCLLAASALHC
jgi:hypothetical protein